MTITAGNDFVKVQADTPKIQLTGSETSAKDLILRENGGVLEIYDNTGGAVLFTFGANSLILRNASGVAVATFTANGLKIGGSIPFIELAGTESSYKDLQIRENAGKIEIYNVGTAAVIATLTGITEMRFVRHLPTKPTTGAAEAAADAWKEAVFEAPPGSAITITDVGVIPDYGTTFGQATNYFTLTCMNKGSGGSGTTQIASKAFSTAATAMVKTSLGTITNALLAAGDVISIEKTITSSGMIAHSCTYYIEFTRTA